MAEVTYQSEMQNGVLVVTVGGFLDFEVAHTFDKELTASIAAGAKNIVLNMAKVDQISSAALGVIIAKNSDVRKHGGGIRMSTVPGEVRKVFELVNFDKVFKIFDNDEDAVASFQNR